MPAIDVLSRWIHVTSAIALMGGAIFAVLAVIPALSVLDEETRKQVKAAIRTRWAKVVHVGILLLLVTGFYNYLAVTGPAHQGDNRKIYHILMGNKILIALVVFFLASVMAGRSAKFDGMRRQDRKWLSIIILLAALVVGIGSYLKVAVPPSEAAPEEPSDVDEGSADDESASNTTEPLPSAVAENFEFNALAKEVAQSVIGGGYSINIDSGGGGGEFYPGRAEHRHTAIWYCDGSGHENEVWNNLISAVESRIQTNGGQIDRRIDETPSELDRYWERHYSLAGDAGQYWGILKLWCIAGDTWMPDQDQKFTVVMTLNEQGP